MKNANEFEKFDGMMRQLLKPPHANINRATDEERAAKKRKNFG